MGAYRGYSGGGVHLRSYTLGPPGNDLLFTPSAMSENSVFLCMLLMTILNVSKVRIGWGGGDRWKIYFTYIRIDRNTCRDMSLDALEYLNKKAHFEIIYVCSSACCSTGSKSISIHLQKYP